MSTIFIDECGYTGQNLLDTEQPLFTLASLQLSEEECKKLKHEFFQDVKSVELKYSSLKRKPKQQELILDFIKHLSKQPHLFKFSVSHKKFVLVSKMVEVLVEPVEYAAGIDSYDKGENIALANLLFYTLPCFGGIDFFNNLLQSFQEMMRYRTKDSYETFLGIVFAEHHSTDLKEVLDFFKPTLFQSGLELLKTQDNLDITVSSMLAMMIFWRKELKDDITLIHDQSSQMAAQKKIWETIVDADLPPIEIGYDIRKAQFPLNVIQTSAEDSKNWAGLQLVDILAGSFTHYAKWLNEKDNVDDGFAQRLGKLIDTFDCYPLFPQPKFTSEELGLTGNNATSPHDYLASLFIKNPQILKELE